MGHWQTIQTLIRCRRTWHLICKSTLFAFNKTISIKHASLRGSISCTSNWWSGGCKFDPHQVQQFFRRDWSWNIFYGHSLPSADSRRASVSFWQKNVHKYWLTAFRTKPVQVVWLDKLTALDMTLIGWLSCKTSAQSIYKTYGSNNEN